MKRFKTHFAFTCPTLSKRSENVSQREKRFPYKTFKTPTNGSVFLKSFKVTRFGENTTREGRIKYTSTFAVGLV